MIKYALGCAEGHEFESWFPDSAAYEKQRRRGLIACPECGSTDSGQGDHGAGGRRRRAHRGREAPPSCSTTSAARPREMIARLRPRDRGQHRRRRREVSRGRARHPCRRRAGAGDSRPREPGRGAGADRGGRQRPADAGARGRAELTLCGAPYLPPPRLEQRCIAAPTCPLECGSKSPFRGLLQHGGVFKTLASRRA